MTVVSESDLCRGLAALGLGAGDLVFVHASLSRFGHVVGGADTVVDALLRCVGPGGTVGMPGFTFGIENEAAPVFDVRHSPVWAGRIYEVFRRRPGVRRSHHLTHSVCALGARAAEWTATHSLTPCGPESPFRKLVEWGGKILFLGVCHNSNTTLHALEEEERLFYVGFRTIEGARIIDETGACRPLPAQVHQMARPYDFNRIASRLDEAGIQRTGVIGDAVVRLIDAAAMYEEVRSIVKRDPEALLRVGPEWMTIPTTRAEYDAAAR